MAAPARDLVFVSYSHKNPEWRDRLQILLKPFERQGRLQVWADQYIQVGAMWSREIESAIERSAVGVVLLTPELLASDFAAEVEIPHLLRAARRRVLTLVIVPIQAHPEGATAFVDGNLHDFQWPWPSDQPIDELAEAQRNRALVTVTNAIVKAMGSGPTDPHPARTSERIGPAPVVGVHRRGVVHGRPPLPPNYLKRDNVHETVREAVLGPATVVGVSALTGSVGVHGQGGVGKTVVAQAIADDDDIARAFPDGIFWITVGQQPRLENLQAELATWAGSPVTVESVADGIRLLREIFHGKTCLVILDDVWAIEHARAFDVLDVASRLLVTTRDRSILTALGARDIRLERLPTELALQLLAAWSGTATEDLPAEAGAVAEEVDFLPLALSLAGAQIRDGQSWRELLAALRAGNLVYLDHPYGSVFRSLQASLDALEREDAQRYLELAVLPEDVAVPVEIVAGLWQATAGYDEAKTLSLVTRLAARNLVRVVDEPPGRAVALHDLQYDFVRLIVSNLTTLHGTLVDSWHAGLHRQAGPDAADDWATMPLSPQYRWQFLSYHLARAGRADKLRALLTNHEWLSAKLTHFPIAAVVADYRDATGDRGLRRVRDALVLSRHVLAKDPSALSAQLVGRLEDEQSDPHIRGLIASARKALQHGRQLTPTTACLTRPGGGLIQTFELNRYSVNAVTVLPDEQHAISASSDQTLRLWDLVTGQVIRTFEGHNYWVHAVTLLPGGQRALSASADRTLKLWDIATGRLLQNFEGHTDIVNAVSVTDGQRALSASSDSTLKLWDLATGKGLATYEDHRGSVNAVTVLPAGRALSASSDGTLKLWDLAAGVVVQTFEGHSESVNAVAVLRDGRRALSASSDRTLKLWDVATAQVLQTFEGHSDSVNAVTILPDDQRALSASADRTLKLWDLANGQPLQTFEGHNDGVNAVTVLDDGRRALSAGFDGTLRLWDLGSGNIRPSSGHRDQVRAVTVLPDGQRALSASSDWTMKLWDIATGTVLATFEGHHGSVSAVAVLPDKQRALSASADWTLKLWDLTSGQVLDTLKGHRGAVNAVTMLRDGRRAVSASSDGTVKLWDLSNAQVLQTFEGHSFWVYAVAVLEEEQRVLSASADRTLKLWDLASGQLLRTFEGHSFWVHAVTVLPDGRRALSASSDGTLKLWDLATGQVLKTFEGHSFWVHAVTVLPDGQRALSASSDGTVKLWDLATAQVQSVFYDDAPVLCLSVTPSGRVLVGNALGRVYALESP